MRFLGRHWLPGGFLCGEEVLDGVVARFLRVGECLLAGELQCWRAVFLCQMEEPHAGAIALLLDDVCREDAVDDPLGAFPNLPPPCAETAAVPFEVLAVVFRHVAGLRAVLAFRAIEARMRCDFLVLEVNLDAVLRDAYIDLLVDVVVGDGVIHPLDSYMVVELHLGRCPVGWLVRDDGKWGEVCFLFFGKDAPAAALALLEGTVVQDVELLGNGAVQVLDGEELLVAERRDDPRGSEADAALRRRLVLRMTDAGRQDGRVVAFGELVIRSIKLRRVPMPLLADNRRGAVVWDEDFRDAAEELIHVHMGFQPCVLLLVHECFGECVLAVWQHANEEVRRDVLTGLAVREVQGISSPVHLGLLARLVVQMHGCLAACLILLDVVAEL